MFVSPVVAQEEQKEEKEEGYIFTDIKVLPVTSVKDQNAAGTCWCYSGLAFFEAELLRMGKPEYDFSEMYIVYNTYMDRAEATVRTHGDVSFAQGGSFYDVIYGMKHYGLVPEEFMRPGAMHGDSLSDFTEFSNVTDPFVEGITKIENFNLLPMALRFGKMLSKVFSMPILVNVRKCLSMKVKNIPLRHFSNQQGLILMIM